MSSGQPKIQLATDLKVFFEEQLSTTAKKQGQVISPLTTDYLARLLTKFSRPQNYLVPASHNIANTSGSENSEKKEIPTLALLWLESLSQPISEQYQQLQFLGDVALFTSGFFRERFDRSLIDMDYYVAMGERAYERAAKIRESIAAERALNIFFELAESFSGFVEIFAELSDQSLLANDQDILKLYQKWLRTGSVRISRMLNEVGVIPSSKTNSGGSDTNFS